MSLLTGHLPSGNTKPGLQEAEQPDRGWHFSLESAGGRGSRAQPVCWKYVAAEINYLERNFSEESNNLHNLQLSSSCGKLLVSSRIKEIYQYF